MNLPELRVAVPNFPQNTFLLNFFELALSRIVFRVVHSFEGRVKSIHLSKVGIFLLVDFHFQNTEVKWLLLPFI